MALGYWVPDTRNSKWKFCETFVNQAAVLRMCIEFRLCHPGFKLSKPIRSHKSWHWSFINVMKMNLKICSLSSLLLMNLSCLLSVLNHIYTCISKDKIKRSQNKLQSVSVTQNVNSNNDTSHLSDNGKTPKVNYLLKNSTSAPNINEITEILNEDSDNNSGENEGEKKE